METCASNTIINHLEVHNLCNNHQWAYKKGHSTELLLVKMSPAWEKALDNKQIVGIVFIDFKKAFNSVSHLILLQKLQSLGISGNIWLWIKDYLHERRMSMIVNGTKSDSCQVKFGIPQGSILGPILFSIFCNDLPEIIQDDEGEFEMYANDTTVYVIGPNPYIVANILNVILQKLSRWCLENLLTFHSGKTEYMLLRSSRFIGPLQQIKLGDSNIKLVNTKICLGLKVDSRLKWDTHAMEVVKSCHKKLNLLKSFHFLPLQARLDFYFKVILQTITYGILIWGSVEKTIFDNLERIHIRAARIIYHYTWDKPSKEVQSQTNWRPLKLFYNLKLLKLVFNHYHNLSPIMLQNLFEKREQVYNFRTTNCLNLPKCRTDYMQKSVVYQGGILWNSLENSARTLDSYVALKNNFIKNL